LLKAHPIEKKRNSLWRRVENKNGEGKTNPWRKKGGNNFVKHTLIVH